jgi:hypothetical protein
VVPNPSGRVRSYGEVAVGAEDRGAAAVASAREAATVGLKERGGSGGTWRARGEATTRVGRVGRRGRRWKVVLLVPSRHLLGTNGL